MLGLNDLCIHVKKKDIDQAVLVYIELHLRKTLKEFPFCHQ